METTDDPKAKSRYIRERSFLFLIAFPAGVCLLCVSSHYDFDKFTEKFTEALGLALMLVVVMDVCFKMLLEKVRSKDHEAQLLAHEWLQDAKLWKSQNEAKNKAAAQEAIVASLKALDTKLEQLSRDIAALSGK
jgi:hypothetical protein